MGNVGSVGVSGKAIVDMAQSFEVGYLPCKGPSNIALLDCLNVVVAIIYGWVSSKFIFYDSTSYSRLFSPARLQSALI